jgi:glycerol-3-phosphate dehydrogenase (NAD(P)+)
MKTILFIGAGEIGTALAHVIGDRAKVEMWDRHADKVVNMKPLEETVPRADVVFVCVPSWVVREVIGGIAKMLRPEAIVVSLAKGIEKDTQKTMDAVLNEVVSQRFAILGGPLLAEELMADQPGIGVFASKDKSAFDEVAPFFYGSNVRLEYASDPYTVALCAMLKNVYAVGLGVADGIGWGWNAKGWIATESLREMQNIVEALGGDSKIVQGSAGAGDFLATAMSPDSRNWATGREIAVTGSCKELSEGCRSIESIKNVLGDKVSGFNLLLSLDRIINKHEISKSVFQDLFTAR